MKQFSQRTLLLLLLSLAISLTNAEASGHGPVFGLATPTLGKGGVSFDFGVMSMYQGGERSLMLKYLWGYGVTEDLQLSLSTHSPIDLLSTQVSTRGSSMMQAHGDIEPLVFWRFHRDDFDIGNRFESTLIVSGTIPTEKIRTGVSVGNALHAALVTGYASRTTYFWLGGGYQYYFERSNDQLGDLKYLSAVFGWRPPLFKEDYPKPDWRIFIESLAEFAGKDKRGGIENPQTGGTKVLVGPSILGLYGDWGISGGILFPVAQNLNGGHPTERFRFMTVLTYWIQQ